MEPEAMAMMMVKVEAREYHLEQLVEELRHLNAIIRRNTIQVVSALAMGPLAIRIRKGIRHVSPPFAGFSLHERQVFDIRRREFGNRIWGT